MNTPRQESVLLGALLDRLGKTQAQALLARLERWLDLEQYRAVGSTYDRRKGDKNSIHNFEPESASLTPKDNP
jgi:hypothetical protein